ncbi:MAG: Holliday junction branch migration protein RuvA [Bacteroidetes bacterium]|nr:Holliday junction branch migration protein RuvA [Bacteroidota bacterium]PIQ33738.1 MAG: Holliday junction branch migration protein RuvA [Bacteroidetes bacterium CG18_big_fil_WC_8_21_14_2_50_41_14]PJB55808.1 MAG: Holliday junction branch migration protein RuvA [Bacteroidetes bacterium CG_4_9_14_3_um_filter_41_19]
MYDYLKGRLVEKNPTFVVIDVNGVGYMVNISLTTFSTIKDQENIQLFTRLLVREDAHLLFGFADKRERTMFDHLLKVSGVGANTARLILSSLSTDEVFTAIAREDANLLQSVKGVGGKTAQRIILDLKDKLPKTGITVEKTNRFHNTIREEALSGMLILGFNKVQAEKVIDKILDKGLVVDVEGLIKEALKAL